MASDPETVIRELYRAMNDRDVEAAARIAHPNVEWVSDPRTGLGDKRGLDAVLGFFLEQAESFDKFAVELDGVEANGDTVLALIRVSGRGIGSGAEVEIRIGHVWRVRDGLVVHGRGFGDRDEARRAAGL